MTTLRARCAPTLALLIAAFIADVARAQAPPPPPDVAVVATLNVQRSDDWLGMHYEILRTAEESAKPLLLSVPAGKGASRAISIMRPKFTITLTTAHTDVLQCIVKGKVSGADAQQTLPAFMLAVVERGAGVGDGVRLEYGLFAVPARLVELRIEDR